MVYAIPMSMLSFGAVLGTDADEILVESAKPLRANVGLDEHGFVTRFNDQMLAIFAG